jgi:hypothetical protein
MIVVGGEPLESKAAPAAAYDPATNTWRSIVAPPILDHGRMADTAVWTGSLMIYWRAFMGRGGYGDDVATYDPTHDRWRLVASPDLSGSFRTGSFWCGKEAITWGIGVPPPVTKPPTPGPRTGVLYDPVRDRLSTMPASTISEDDQLAVVAGGRLVASDYVVGDSDPSGVTGTLRLASFDCATSAWEQLPDSPMVGSAGGLAWTGREVLAWSTAGPSKRYRVGGP